MVQDEMHVLAQMRGSAPQFVQEVSTPLPGTAKFDVVMCGGTLGIFLACALQLKGLRCSRLRISAAIFSSKHDLDFPVPQLSGLIRPLTLLYPMR